MSRLTLACPPQALIDAYKESHDARAASDVAERRLLAAARAWLALWRSSLTAGEGVGGRLLAAFDVDKAARERMARAKRRAVAARRRAYGPLHGKGARGSARRGRPGNRTGRTRPHR